MLKVCACLIASSLLAWLGFFSSAYSAQPNVVIILCDNLGYGDVACFQPQAKQRTPNLDRMATEGIRLTSFYSTSGVCTSSRASLMTGCYPRRVGLHVSATGASVLQPVGSRGINPAEQTIAELLKGVGYATTCIGKWHLGDQPIFLATRNGFDSFFGIPYSEDMERGRVPGLDWPELPLLRNEKVIEAPPDAQFFTKRMTEEAVNFIVANKDRPFFLYFPEAAPGSRTVGYPGPDFIGKSANGLYGDSVEELDWSTGEILNALKQNGLDENTIVIWTSDNGALTRNPTQGSNLPFTGMGNSTREGGQRMPCIVRWPNKIPQGGYCDKLCTMMDLLPTLTKLCGAPLPKAKIDGHDIMPLLLGTPNVASPYDKTGFFYYYVKQLQAVRIGKWKLYLPLTSPKVQALRLYDVQSDIAEKKDVSAKFPTLVAKITALADRARHELGDNDQVGTGQRSAGEVANPQPLLLSN